MADTPDLYATLDLERDASPAAIKTAYRKAVRRTHPDVNKADDAEEQFRLVQLAYDVLSDPARRAKYDATGTIDPDTPDNTVGQLISALSATFNEVMATVMGAGQDPTKVDIVGQMVDILLDNERAIEKAQAQFARNRAVLMRMVDRFEAPEGQPNHLQAMVRGQIADIDANVETNKRALEQARAPRLYLQGCKYRHFDPFAAQLMPSSMTRTWGL